MYILDSYFKVVNDNLRVLVSLVPITSRRVMGTSSACDTAAEILCRKETAYHFGKECKKKRSLAQGRDSLRFLYKRNFVNFKQKTLDQATG
jgi:hypothetical protein